MTRTLTAAAIMLAAITAAQAEMKPFQLAYFQLVKTVCPNEFATMQKEIPAFVLRATESRWLALPPRVQTEAQQEVLQRIEQTHGKTDTISKLCEAQRLQNEEAMKP